MAAELKKVLEEIKQATDDIKKADNRLHEVEEKLKTADAIVATKLEEEQRYLRLKELALRQLLSELQHEKNRLAEAQDRSAAAGPGPGSAAAAGSQLQRQLETLPNPSDLAYSKQWSQNHTFFRCFRPTAGVGSRRALPIALYDPVLDELVGLFGAALKGGGGDGVGISISGGVGISCVPPSNEDCVMAIRLCEDMAKSFAAEQERVAAFTTLLKIYLGERIDAHHPIPTANFETGGSLLCEVSGPAWVPVYIQEVKAEIGATGDPYFQGQRYHQLYVVNPELATVVRHTVLPVLFVELVGPHLRVSALASPADITVVCEPLTPYMHLFNMQRCQPDHMNRLALVLRALKSGIGLLKAAYGRLQQPTASPTAAHLASAVSASAAAAGLVSEVSSSAAASAGPNVAAVDPTVLHVKVPLRNPSLQLPYPLRREKDFRDVQPIRPGECNPLYFAEHEGRAVAVKFARMSADAIRVQEAWAEAGLAPKVVQHRLLPCGLTMLVMEQLAPADGWVMFFDLPEELKQRLNGVVVEALASAHTVVVDAARGLRGVHADLRQANVVVRLLREGAAAGSSSGGSNAAGAGGKDMAGGSGSSQPQVPVRFVDFDWSGLQGHTRLPPFSRMQLQGYGSGCEVTQEYDRALWEYERVHRPT